MVFTEKKRRLLHIAGMGDRPTWTVFGLTCARRLLSKPIGSRWKHDAEGRPEARVIGRAKPAVMWRRDTLKRQSYVVVPGRDIT